jgi:uncharacterized lipoprotein YddW (UPF0748 family)
MPSWRLAMVCSFFVVAAAPARAQPNAKDHPELRALWVDAFHEGIRSAREADDLVAAAKRANLNTLIVQVRRRGDALYTKSVEPPLDDPAYDPSFDALAYVVDAAHRAGLEVHAWVNAMPVWRDEEPPKDARHVFNSHGPTARAEDNWLTAAPDGNRKFPVGYFLDPGHPAAAAYLAEIYLNIVRNYAVDGIHFDYIRYPETEGRLPRGADVGYNAVNLARFHRATGRHDVPSPGDEAWMKWRRQQVTNLVRRVSIEAKAINPRIKISGALIPWGQPPSSEKNFEDVAPMQRIFQNWHEWLATGLLDLGIPMNYATETDERVRGWFDGWIRWEKHHGHGRQLAVGLGAYRNRTADTVAQVRRARTPDGDGRVVGVSFFSYAVPVLPASVQAGTDLPSVPVTGVDRLAYLTEVFARPAPVPPMEWIDRPSTGWIAGIVKSQTSGDNDGIVVTVKRKRFWPFGNTDRIRTDGNGYFGLSKVKPGNYKVTVRGNTRSLSVAPGKVSRANF